MFASQSRAVAISHSIQERRWQAVHAYPQPYNLRSVLFVRIVYSKNDYLQGQSFYGTR